MTIIYYGEINLICIIILLLFTNQMRYKSDQLSYDNRTFKMLLCATIIMCASDMVAGICRGQFFAGARVLIEVSNILYFEAVSVTSFLWMIYVLTKLKIISNYYKNLIFWAIPLIAISIAVLSNPFTNLMFTIDENNLYSRNIGVYFHWIVSWLYLLTTTGIIAYKIIKEQNKSNRGKIIPLLNFIIAPVIAAVVQSIFYGVTCYQAGITISIVAISLVEQNHQTLTDSLTGLSNRYGLNKYLENYMRHHLETKLFLMIIDINNFKQVNDMFGHLEGDRALSDVADAVNLSCHEATSKLFVCRYGGDEFLIAGCDCLPDEMMDLKNKINKKLEEINCLGNYPYVLSVSIGQANGICLDSDDIDHLLRMADEAMYDEKKQSKNIGIKTISKE